MRKSEFPDVAVACCGTPGGTTNQQDNVHLMYIKQKKTERAPTRRKTNEVDQQFAKTLHR